MTFFDNYTYKQKNLGLAIIALLLIGASYKKAFSVSLETKDYRNELLVKLEKAKHAQEDIKTNQLMISKLNRFLGEEGNSVEKVQQGFLNFFADFADGITVYQINEVLNFKHPDFEINTHRIVLKGNYKNTLQFIYKLEKDFSLAKILNTKFEYERNSIEEDKALFTTLLIQNYLK